MSISYDVTATLRQQMKHHEPIVLIKGGRCSCGFIPRESGKTRSIGYGVEVLPTMNADGNYAVLVYERHDQDSRYKPLGEISETVSAKYGTGGGNGSVVICSTKERSDRCAKMITRDRTGSTPIKTN